MEKKALWTIEKKHLAKHIVICTWMPNGKVIPGKSTLGALAIGVPGTIDALFEVHQKFGKLPMAELIQPAIDLARNGVVITPLQADFYMGKNVEQIKKPIIMLLLLRMDGRQVNVLSMRN